jgi:hypothetical protein
VPRPLRFAALVVTLGLAAPATTGAATAFTAGNGVAPAIAVAADGTGQVAWQTDTVGTADQIQYCRVPAGGSACTGLQTLDFPHPAGKDPVAEDDSTQVFVPAPGKVVLAATCFVCGTAGDATDRTFRWVSTDGGVSFAAPEEVGTTVNVDGQGTLLPGDVLALPDRAGRVATMPGAPPQTYSGFFTNFSPSVVAVPGTNQILAADNDLESIKYGVFGGAGLTPMVTDIAIADPKGDESETDLIAGSSGVFLTNRQFVPNNEHVLLRRYDPAMLKFGAARAVEGADPIDNSAINPDSYEDAGGRIHIVYRSNFDGGRLRYLRSDNGGVTFSPGQNLAAKEDFRDPRVAADPTGHGFAVWRANGSGPIRVVALDPSFEKGIVPEREATGTVAGATLAVAAPSGCVLRGSSFKVTLKIKRKKRKGSLFVKVRRADFFVAAKRIKTDKTAPFVQRVTVDPAKASGSKLVLRVRAFIKVRHGKEPKKSIRTTVTIC